tara:strand:+ start:37 stop:354 length:318 start_codon:yes stop_codon:yes gene_type:complete
MSINVIDAVLEINPSAVISVSNNDIDSIEWLNGTTPISKSDIENKIAELQTAYDNQEYARNRLAAYPSLQEFAEAYCEKEIGGDSTKWDAYVVNYNKVRSDNPKE